MLLEEGARLGEVHVAPGPVVAVCAHCVGNRLRVAGRHELDRGAALRLRRIAGAELVDSRPRARHALVHLVADHAARLLSGAEHAKHHVVGADDLRHLDVRHLVEEADVRDARGLGLSLCLVRAPAKEVPLYALVLRHARRLHDVLRTVERKVRAVVEHLERFRV